MDSQEQERKDKRRGQIAATHNAIANHWQAIHDELEHRKQMLVKQLCDHNDDKIRGRINELQSLQRLPQDLRAEAERLDSVIELPEESEELTGDLGRY